MSCHQTTLVVHVGGIGDFLLCCPALLRLSSLGPVVLLGNTDRLCLGMAAGAARAIHDINTIGFESVFNVPNERFRQFTRSFNRAIIWMKDEKGLIREGFRQCGIRNVQAFPGLPPPDWKDHASTYYLKCLGFRELSPLQLRVEPSPLIHEVIIHPGSGGKSKNWPAECYLELAERLKKRDLSVTWCLGPAEDDFALPEGERSIRTGSLLELSRLLVSARLYIGNDCGITHLAAATGCRTIAVFGPTNPFIWAPRGRHVKILKGDPWPEPAAVLDAVRGLKLTGN